jgi:hypothetical protein
MGSKQSWQFGLRALIVTTTIVAVALGVYVCPPPARPLLFKAIGGMALFIPILLAAFAGDWLESWRHRK